MLVNIRDAVRLNLFLFGFFAILLPWGFARGQVAYYVDANDLNADNDGFGSSLVPWQTLSRALDTSESPAITAGDTLYVRSAVYDADVSTDGVAESFPILIPPGVTIVGVNNSDGAPSLSQRPRVGGGVAGVETHLFEVNATAGNVATGRISRFTFVGEDVAGLDSAIALMVKAGGGFSAEVDFRDNICERPQMNDSGAGGLATIHLEVEDGEIRGDITGCVIETSNRGGVEMVSIQEDLNVDPTSSTVRINITDNSFTNPGGAYSSFGIRWHAPTPDSAQVTPPRLGAGAWDGNTITSRGGNLQVGVEVVAEEFTNFGTALGIRHNKISGCGSSGVVLKADGWDAVDGLMPEIAGEIHQNTITECGGSGVVLYWDESNHVSDTGAGYIEPRMFGNIIADNDAYGIAFRNVGVSSEGETISENNTIVYNGLGGLGFPGLIWSGSVEYAGDSTHKNDIVYYNNPNSVGTPQVVGLTGAQLAAFELGITFSDWSGIDCAPSCTTGSIDSAPMLITAAGPRQYHILSDLSDCVDAGDDPTLTTDIDGESRVQNGSCGASAVVDMGADELTEDCP